MVKMVQVQKSANARQKAILLEFLAINIHLHSSREHHNFFDEVYVTDSIMKPMYIPYRATVTAG